MKILSRSFLQLDVKSQVSQAKYDCFEMTILDIKIATVFCFFLCLFVFTRLRWWSGGGRVRRHLRSLQEAPGHPAPGQQHLLLSILALRSNLNVGPWKLSSINSAWFAFMYYSAVQRSNCASVCSHLFTLSTQANRQTGVQEANIQTDAEVSS